MQLLTCQKCGAQFDVASMQSGTTFTCGRCGSGLTVPASTGPVMQPIQPQRRGYVEPPATVVLTPDQMKAALRASAAAPPPAQAPAQPQRPAGQQKPKLPKAMQQRARSGPQGGRSGAPEAPPPQQPAQKRRPAGKRPASKPQGRPAAKPQQQQQRQQKQQKQQRRPAQDERRPSGGRGGRGGAREEAPEKSKTGMIVGIAVGAVALIAIVAFVLNRRGEQETGEVPGITDPAVTDTTGTGTDATGTTPGAPAAGTGTGTDPAGTQTPAKPQSEHEKFLAMSPSDKQTYITQRLSRAEGSPAQFKLVHEFFTDEQMGASKSAAEGAKRAAEEALRLDEDLEWARVGAGQGNAFELLSKVVDECEKAFEFPDPDSILLKRRLEELKSAPWVPIKEFKELEGLATRVRERNEALKTDTRLIQVEKALDFVRKNPIFEDIKDNIIFKVAEPYVLFQEFAVEKDESLAHFDVQRREKADLLVRREATLLSELHNRFRTMFADKHKLDTLQKHGRVLRVLLLWNRETFNAWHEKQGSGVSGFVRAYYSPVEKYFVHYVGEGSFRGRDEYKVANGRIQKGADQVTIHEGMHQLMHEYRGVYQGKPLSDEDKEVAARKAMFFGEGMSEFMSAVEYEEKYKESLDDVEWFHNRILISRTNDGRRFRALSKKWTLAELTGPNHNGELMQRGNELAPGQSGAMGALFYGRSWAFVHFAWWYDNGKYRANVVNCVEKYLANTHSGKAFAMAFGVSDPKKWGEIEKEYEWYWDQCLMRPSGERVDPRTGKHTGIFFTPETTPPEGKYTDDAEGGDYDDEEDEEDEEDDE